MERREFMRAGMGAIAVGAAPAAALAMATTPRAGWDAAMARLTDAEARASVAGEAFDRAARAYRAAQIPKPEGLIMHQNGRALTQDDAWQNLKAKQAAWATQDAALRARHQLAELREADCAATDAKMAAESELLAMPAPDRQALLWKVERFFDVMGEDAMEPMLADARRLLGDA